MHDQWQTRPQFQGIRSSTDERHPLNGKHTHTHARMSAHTHILSLSLTLYLHFWVRGADISSCAFQFLVVGFASGYHDSYTSVQQNTFIKHLSNTHHTPTTKQTKNLIAHQKYHSPNLSLEYTHPHHTT